MAIGWTEIEALDPAWREGLFGPGQLFELVPEDVTVGGRTVTLPCFPQRPRSLGEVLDRAAAQHAEVAALVGPTETISFGGLPGRVSAVAAHLADAHGVGAGDRVGLMGGVSVDHCLAVWAIAELGAIAVTMNPAWTDDEIAHARQLTAPAVVLADDDRGTPFASLPSDAAAPPARADRDDDPFAIVFTSGTEGRPKGATLSHRNAIHFSLSAAATSAVHSIVAGIPATRAPNQRVFASGHLFHVSGLLGQLTNSSMWGSTLVIPPPGRWDATAHLEATERHAITSWTLVPTQLRRLVDHPELDRFDLTSLEMIGGGGAAFDPALLARTAERLPGVSTALRVGYGMTESSGTLTMLQPPCTDEQRSSVGPPVAGTEVEVRDTEGRAVPDGEVGQVHGRGAQIFVGYWGDDAATAAAVDPDGWYATGDIGRIVDGSLTLASRRKDLILRGGENIYPIEIENRLVAHPAVAEAAVIGMPHDDLGEVVRAVVVAADGATIEPDELREWCGQALARHKVPQVVDVVDELPRNTVGKVLTNQLRAMPLPGEAPRRGR